MPILDHLSQGFLAGVSSEWSSASTSADGDQITAEMIDDMARRHFPACMRNLHECLRRDKHLKHFGRLQYGLFLKVTRTHTSSGSQLTGYLPSQVLGLSIDEAVAFWRRSFSNIQDDKFNKEYKYNIRHSYGLEGKRANYPAKRYVNPLWSVSRLIMPSPAVNKSSSGTNRARRTTTDALTVTFPPTTCKRRCSRCTRRRACRRRICRRSWPLSKQATTT